MLSLTAVLHALALQDVCGNAALSAQQYRLAVAQAMYLTAVRRSLALQEASGCASLSARQHWLAVVKAVGLTAEQQQDALLAFDVYLRCLTGTLIERQGLAAQAASKHLPLHSSPEVCLQQFRVLGLRSA